MGLQKLQRHPHIESIVALLHWEEPAVGYLALPLSQ